MCNKCIEGVVPEIPSRHTIGGRDQHSYALFSHAERGHMPSPADAIPGVIEREVIFIPDVFFNPRSQEIQLGEKKADFPTVEDINGPVS